MSTANTTVAFNEAMLTLVLSKYYRSNTDKFAGSTTISDLDVKVSWAATTPPSAKLYSASGGHNVTATFSTVAISIDDESEDPITLAVSITAELVLSNGVLSLTSLASNVTGGGSAWINKKFSPIVDKLIAQQYQAEVEHIQLPQFSNLFGSGLSATVLDASIVDGFADLGVALSASGGASSGTRPSANNVQSPGANVAVSISASGLQIVLDTQRSRFPISYPFREVTEHKEGILGHFGAGITGTLALAMPHMAVAGNHASAAGVVSFSGLEGGVEAFGEWTWIPLPEPEITAGINVVLTTDSTHKTAKVAVTGVGAIAAHFNWPGVLAPVGETLASLLDDVLDAFRSDISSALEGMAFDVLTLPGTLAGAPFSLHFASLGFASGCLQAVISAA